MSRFEWTSLVGILAVTLFTGSSLGAQVAKDGKQQAAAEAADAIPVRQLLAASATSTETLGSVAAVRQLSNGNVLINDQAKKRVLLLDEQLKLLRIVADTTVNTLHAYGPHPDGLIAYRGDSTLLVDPASLSMLVLDAKGQIVRTMAAPRPADVNFLTGGSLGNPGFDSKDRLVYRVGIVGSRLPSTTGQSLLSATPPDTAPVVRFDLATRKLDTAGFCQMPRNNVQITQDATGARHVSIRTNPLPVVDEWVVMSDGTVAFVRGHDYHVDFVVATDAIRRGEKIPYAWQRMTDDDKQRFLDSAKVALTKARATAPQEQRFFDSAKVALTKARAMAPQGDIASGAPSLLALANIEAKDPAAVNQPSGSPSPVAGAPGGDILMVPISELSDYKPVFGAGAVRADMDNRIWVRTIPTKPTAGGAIYDVIDRSGSRVNRVQVPVGTTIAGFGIGSTIFLGVRDSTGLHLQRIQWK